MKLNFKIIAALVAVLAFSAASFSDASAKVSNKKHHSAKQGKKAHKAVHKAKKHQNKKADRSPADQHVGGIAKTQIISGQ